MPHVVNGIGTWYYGKKNRVEEIGVCEFCHKEGKLRSYDTWLCFCVVFIPVIPLGRKRITRECPKCRRHRVAPLAKWNEERDAQIATGTEAMQGSPEDPEAAMKLHGALWSFGKLEEANKLAALIEERFPNHAPLLIQLMVACERQGKPAEVERLAEKALAADPAYVPARRAAGVLALRKYQLERAEELLRCLLDAGEHQDSGPLVNLAVAYQKAGEHESALNLLRPLQEAFPKLLQDKSFRKAVRKSEKALKVETALPKRKRNYRPLMGVASVLALIALAVFVFNYYFATHQRLYVVNGSSSSVEVTIDGGKPRRVGGGAVEKLGVPEGVHYAQYELPGGVNHKVKVEMPRGFSNRFGSSAVRVLNLGGMATLEQKTIGYGTAVVQERDAFKYFIGEEFFVIGNINFPFKDLPPRIEVKSGRPGEARTGLSVVKYPPEDVISSLYGMKYDHGRLLNFAEAHLRDEPRNDSLLNVYLALCDTAQRLSRARAFLASGLERRPILTNWHRYYQQFSVVLGKKTELLEQYDGLLAAQPEDSALLYLRGRIETPTPALAYYDRAIAADPNNAYPCMAKAYSLMVTGRPAEALPWAKKAADLAPNDAAVQTYCLDARQAAGETDALIEELAARWGAQSDFAAAAQLVELYALAGRYDEMQKAAEWCAVESQKLGTPEALQTSENWRWCAMYLCGDVERFAEAAVASPENRGYRFAAQIETDDLAGAEKTLDEGRAGGTDCLLLSLAWRLRGRDAESEQWLSRARDSFAKGPVWSGAAGVLLDGRSGEILERSADLTLSEGDRMIVNTVLAGLYPAERDELLHRAEVFLAVQPGPPARFLRRVIADMRVESPTSETSGETP